MKTKKISFVIPCYCSEHTLENVILEVQNEMKQWENYEYEIILINDASRDNTFSCITKLCNDYSNVIGIDFSKNFGQHAALMAGFRKVTGDYIVCLDDDGQTPANEVKKLIDKLEEGFDVAYAQYGNKKHSLFRNFGSKVNELMLRAMLGKPKSLYVSSYFAAKRFIIDNVIEYGNSYPYVIGLVLRATNNITNVMVEHRERLEGNSGYTIKKLLGLWFNGFTAFSIKPLRIATVLGGISAVGGFGYGIYTIIKKMVVPDIPIGFSSQMAALVFFGGMIMLMLGLIGEYIGRIYISMNNSPQYVVKECIESSDKEEK